MRDGTRQFTAVDTIRTPELRLYDQNNGLATWTDSFGASFEADSTVLNYLNSLEYEHPPVEGYKSVPDIPPDMSYYMGEYLDSKSPGETEQITARLRYEQKRNMTAGEHITANVLGALSGTLFGSPEYLPLMFTPWTAAGRGALAIGTTAKAVGAARHLRSAARLGGLVAAEEVAHEAILHQSTLSRTMKESAMNVGVAGLFGATIGGVSSAVMRSRYMDEISEMADDAINGNAYKRIEDFIEPEEKLVINADNSVTILRDVGTKSSKTSFDNMYAAEDFLRKRAGVEPRSVSAAEVARGMDEAPIISPWKWERKWRKSEWMRKSPLRSANISLERALPYARSAKSHEITNRTWGTDRPTGATEKGYAKGPSVARRAERLVGAKTYQTKQHVYGGFFEWLGKENSKLMRLKTHTNPKMRKLWAQYNRELDWALRNNDIAQDGNKVISKTAVKIRNTVDEVTDMAVEQQIWGTQKVPIRDEEGKMVVGEDGKVLLRDEPIDPRGSVKYANSWWARGWVPSALRRDIAVVQAEMRRGFKEERIEQAAETQEAELGHRIVKKKEKQQDIKKEISAVKKKNKEIIERAEKWLGKRIKPEEKATKGKSEKPKTKPKKLTKAQTEGIGARKAKIAAAKKELRNKVEGHRIAKGPRKGEWTDGTLVRQLSKLSDEIADLEKKIDDIGSESWLDRQINEYDLFEGLEGDVQKTFGDMSYGRVDGRVYGDDSFRADSFKERMVPIHDNIAIDPKRGWFNPDVLHNADNYFESTIRPTLMKAEHGDAEMEKTLEGLMDHYGVLAADAGAQGNTKLQNSLLNEARENVRMHMVAKNRYYHRSLVPKDPKSIGANLSRILRDFNVQIRMGGVTPTSLSDIGRYNLAKIYAPEIGRFGTTVRDGMKSLRANKEMMHIAGVAHEATKNTRAARMMDIDDPNPADWAVTRGMDKLAYALMRSTLLSEYTDYGKLLVANIFQNELWRVAKRWDELTPKTKAKLANKGVDETLVNDIKAEFKAGNIKYLDDEKKAVATNWGTWKNKEAADRFADLVFKESERVLGTPNELTMPIWADSELGKLIMQFKSFSLAAHQQVTSPLGDQMKQGDLLAYQTIATALAMGVITEVIKAAIAGEDAWDKIEKYTPSDWVYAAIDRSALIPLLLLGFNGLDISTKNNISKALGKTEHGNPSRYAWERGLGPSPALVTDLFDVGSNFFAGDFDERNMRTLRRLLPFNNLAWISRGVDEIEDFAAGQVPSSRKRKRKFQ